MCSACHLMVLTFVSSVSGVDTKIVNTQRAITPKVGKPELWFISSARRLMAFNICVKFHENMSSSFKVMEQTQKNVNIQRAITPKEGNPELRFLCSACRLIVLTFV